jgi:hypothetical protein
LELVYLEAARGCLPEEPQGSLSFIKKGFKTVKKQVAMLLEVGNAKEDKFKVILEQKGKVLEMFFYLEYASRYCCSELA